MHSDWFYGHSVHRFCYEGGKYFPSLFFDDVSRSPEDIKYATYFNRDRDSIKNAALFQQRCELLYKKTDNTNDSIMISSDQLEMLTYSLISGLHDITTVCRTFINPLGLHFDVFNDVVSMEQTGQRVC